MDGMNAPPSDGLEAGGAAVPAGHLRHPLAPPLPPPPPVRESFLKVPIPINKISLMQALMISGLQLALSLGNALDQNAFQFESGSDLIFGSSALMEAVGFLFAIWMAATALFRPATADNAVGSGIPAMVLWEGISTGSPELISKALYRGIWAQALVFLVTLCACWIASPGTRPHWAFEDSTGQTVGLVVIALWAACCVVAAFAVRGGVGILIALHLGIIPLGVEVYESVLLFSRNSSMFVTYVLAILDLVVVAPALALVPVYVRFLRDEERRRRAL